MTISRRLTLWYGVSMLIIASVTGAIVMTVIHLDRHATVHQKLFAAQNSLLPFVSAEIDGAPTPLGLDTLKAVYAVTGPLAVYARVIDLQGNVLETSTNSVHLFPPSLPHQVDMTEFEHREDGVLFRSMYGPLLVDGEHIGWLETSAYGWDGELFSLHEPAFMAIFFTLIFSLIGGSFLAKRAISPVSKLRQAAARITSTDLSVRLPTDGEAKDELSDLADTFNDMLARIEDGFIREKKLTADAAHEMMNPLSIIATEAEISLRKKRDTTEMEASLQQIHGAATRLSGLLAGLLSLSRIQSDTDHAGATADLLPFIQGWDNLATESGKSFQFNLRGGDSKGRTDLESVPDDVVTIINVLVDNAFKYTKDGGLIRVVLSQNATETVVEVHDNGLGIASEELDRVFDRFYRSNRDEITGRSGSGLGLSIAAAAAERIRGSISVHSDGVGEGTVFTAVIPR